MTDSLTEFVEFQRDGRPWLRHVSGRELPVVRGASDAVDLVDDGGGDTEVVDEGPGPDFDALAGELEEQLDTGEIDPAEFKSRLSDLRRENQKYRERYKPIASTYEGLEDNEVASIGQFVQWYRDGDPRAAVWLLNTAEGYAGDRLSEIAGEVWKDKGFQFGAKAAPSNEAVEEATGVDLSDPESVAKFIEKQVDAKLSVRTQQEREQLEQQQAMERVKSKLSSHGYEWGDEGPAPATRAVAALTATAFKGDVDAAHTFWQTTVQNQVKAEVAAELKKRGIETGAPPPAPTGTAAAPRPTDGMSRMERAMARLEGTDNPAA
jgi:hypothetical protein